MAVKLNINWRNPNTRSVVINLYKSLTRFDSNNLPSIFAEIPRGQNYYVDTQVEYNQTYYYMFSCEYNGSFWYSECFEVIEERELTTWVVLPDPEINEDYIIYQGRKGEGNSALYSYAEYDLKTALIESFKDENMQQYGAFTGAVEQLIGSVDWVVDPANNQIKYSQPSSGECSVQNCDAIPRLYTLNNLIGSPGIHYYSDGDAACRAFKSNRDSYGVDIGTYIGFDPIYGCKFSTGNGMPYGIEDNPSYNPDAEQEQKTLPLDVVAAQVISNAQAGDEIIQMLSEDYISKVANSIYETDSTPVELNLESILIESLSDTELRQWQAVSNAIVGLTSADSWTFDDVNKQIKYRIEDKTYPKTYWRTYIAGPPKMSAQQACDNAANNFVNAGSWLEVFSSIPVITDNGDHYTGHCNFNIRTANNPSTSTTIDLSTDPTLYEDAPILGTLSYLEVAQRIISDENSSDEMVSLLADAYIREVKSSYLLNISTRSFIDVDFVIAEFERNLYTFGAINLEVETNPVGMFNISWNTFGSPSNNFNVYISESAISETNKPSPITSTTTYLETTKNTSILQYVRIGSFKNGREVLSETLLVIPFGDWIIDKDITINGDDVIYQATKTSPAVTDLTESIIKALHKDYIREWKVIDDGVNGLSSNTDTYTFNIDEEKVNIEFIVANSDLNTVAETLVNRHSNSPLNFVGKEAFKSLIEGIGWVMDEEGKVTKINPNPIDPRNSKTWPYLYYANGYNWPSTYSLAAFCSSIGSDWAPHPSIDLRCIPNGNVNYNFPISVTKSPNQFYDTSLVTERVDVHPSEIEQSIKNALEENNPALAAAITQAVKDAYSFDSVAGYNDLYNTRIIVKSFRELAEEIIDNQNSADSGISSRAKSFVDFILNYGMHDNLIEMVLESFNDTKMHSWQGFIDAANELTGVNNWVINNDKIIGERFNYIDSTNNPHNTIEEACIASYNNSVSFYGSSKITGYSLTGNICQVIHVSTTFNYEMKTNTTTVIISFSDLANKIIENYLSSDLGKQIHAENYLNHVVSNYSDIKVFRSYGKYSLEEALVNSFHDTDLQTWGAFTGAVEQLTGTSDWVVDPVNNQIKYFEDPEIIDPNSPTLQKRWCWDHSSQRACGDSPASAGQSYVTLFNHKKYVSYSITIPDTQAAVVYEDQNGQRQTIYILYADNPHYNPNAETEREEKTLPLDVVAQKVISNTENGDEILQMLSQDYINKVINSVFEDNVSKQFVNVSDLNIQFDANIYNFGINNLSVDITNGFEVKWEPFGYPEYFKYYLSSTPIDINHLPEAKVKYISGNTSSYKDQDEITGANYIRIEVIKNGKEILSDEVIIYPELSAPFNVNFEVITL